MYKRTSLSTLIVLVLFMAGLTSQGAAQTYGRPIPFNERNWKVNDPLAAAKTGAAQAVRSRAAVTVPLSKAAGTFLTFDAPGALNGTFPLAVSASGIIAGYYQDVNSLSHGFLRAANGRFVTFDVPGAVYGSYPDGVNNEGAITGSYSDNVGSGSHSFVRAPHGTILTFDPPGQTLGSGGTAINSDGTIVGSYFNGNYTQHGFLRSRRGNIITTDALGAVNTGRYPWGTLPFGITADGSVLGVYTDASGTTFGYLMTAFGRFVKVTGPGGLGGQLDPLSPLPALSIGPSGVITGTYFQPITGNPFGGNYRVFVRSPDGNYVTFDAASYSPCCIWSAASGIDPDGTITGSFNDGYSINHGFWRTRRGTVTTFDVPGAGTGFNEGTLPIGITWAGVIAGSYSDANRITHGFIFRPESH